MRKVWERETCLGVSLREEERRHVSQKRTLCSLCVLWLELKSNDDFNYEMYFHIPILYFSSLFLYVFLTKLSFMNCVNPFNWGTLNNQKLKMFRRLRMYVLLWK